MGHKNLKEEKKDAAVSASMMLLLSGAIMAVAAGTLYVSGQTLENTVEMIGLFEPIGGKVAAFILIIGIAGAGLSTDIPHRAHSALADSRLSGHAQETSAPLHRASLFS